MRLSRSAFCAICLSVLCAPRAYSEEADLPPIEHLAEIAPQASMFEALQEKEPRVIKSAEEVAKYFDKEAQAALTKRVDFTKQIVLVFAWKGSGQDKLDYKVLESFPEQVVFELTPGQTEDLRSHARVYVLRSNVKWSGPAKQ